MKKDPAEQKKAMLSFLYGMHRDTQACMYIYNDNTKHNSSAQRQKSLTGYCFKNIDRPFCLQTDEL